MTHARRWFAVMAVAVVLPLMSSSCRIHVYVDGCVKWTRELDFETSDQILRGTWQGVALDYPSQGMSTDLTVDLAAIFVDSETYAVAGPFALGADDPLTLDGTVHGRCSERYVATSAESGDVSLPMPADDVTRASAPPPASLVAEVRDSNGVLVWTARAPLPGFDGPGSDHVVYLAIEGELDGGGGLRYSRVVEMSRMDTP